MQTDILIIGGGLSGLVAAWQLQRAGQPFCLLEARPRFGGRVLTLDVGGAACDLGPSWFWPGQPLVAGLLDHFDIPTFEQYADGVLLFQQADGRVLQAGDPSPMAGSLRVEGGIARLAEALAAEIDPARRFVNHAVTGLSIDNNVVTVDVSCAIGIDVHVGNPSRNRPAAAPGSGAGIRPRSARCDATNAGHDTHMDGRPRQVFRRL